MDFPGGATTNVYLVDGFSTIYWRIYTEEPTTVNPAVEGPANGYTILKHLGRLKNLEARLRNLNCLASCPRRLGLWVFSPTPNFESLNSLYVKEGDSTTTKILVDTTNLKVSASGNITSQNLIRGLSSESQDPNGSQSAGTQRPQQGQPSSRRSDGYSSSVAIYASFISAVTGAISIHLIRRYGALPLGSRTLFTPVEQVGYESPRIDSESVLSTSYLTTLNVQLTTAGTVTIAPLTVFQQGIARLCSPSDDISNVLRVQQGSDLWLCPNGAIARLVTANLESPTVPSPDYSNPGDFSTKRRQWKLDVVQWLTNFGLQIESIEEEPWVEVEVWEPFFARLAGEVWRQTEETQSALPLKRMLWPARFCFRRCGQPIQSSWLQDSLDDPLEFLGQWSPDADSLKPKQNTQSKPTLEEPPVKDHEMSSPRVDNVEVIESLSRMSQYYDLQTTNLVYPTPPEGATAMGINHTNQSDAFPDDVDFLSPAAAHDKHTSNTEHPANNPIGTGKYDASDDDDLFGEMNERDFGSKGITDADFSFFDEPDLEGMGDEPSVDHPKETLQAQVKSKGLEEGEMEDIIVPESAPSEIIESAQPTEKEHALEPVQDTEPGLADSPMASASSAQSSPRPESQPISPPLSPVEIKKILFSGQQPDHQKQSKDSHLLQGHYHPIAFEKKIGDWDQKYGAAGKFWFSTGVKPDTLDKNLDAIPTVGIPHRARASVSQVKANGTNESPSIPEERSRSSSVSSSASSPCIDEMPMQHAPTPLALPTLKRKRVSSETDIQSVASTAKSSNMPEVNLGSKAENSTFLGNFLANFSDWTLTGYFSALQIQQLPVLLRREDQMPIAQLLVDQITQSSLDHVLDGNVGLFGLESDNLTLRTCMEDAVFLGEMAKLDLKGYATLQDETAAESHQPSKESARTPISKVAAPHLRVRRGKEFLETLPPAISFWETFGLEPARGPKDITAYCIHPKSASKSADSFLYRFGLTYQSCNFGNHSRGEKSMAFEDGMRAWDTESSYSSMMQSLKGLCEELGADLSQSSPSSNNCVVYIVNPFPHAAALADICTAFWHLFQQLVANADLRQSRQVNDVVLQIIPMNFITSGKSMVVPTQTEYLELALEVYGRCRPKEADLSPVVCAPAILLAEPLPEALHFRLASEKGSPLQDGRSLHIACSKSADQRWMSVAWSDGTGSIQTTMSYCLRYRSKGAARTVAEVRNEIWATTKHIMEKFQARWRVVLVNTEPMDQDDIEGWSVLADQVNKMRPGSLELTMITVITTPELTLEAPASAMTTAVLNPQLSSTPVSTPNPSASIASPEQSGNAPTPSATYNAPTPTEPSIEPDSDVVLADISDESWVVILSHRLNSSPHLTEFRPALASGYLLRRKGTTDGEGVFSMTVNLVYSQRPSSSHAATLKETLGMYRDLASLARAKGMRSVQNNTLPWHIATALRAQELLSYVF
ncbi:Mediator complex subunit Med13 [Penicillium maclennaniae]|uniref:Mediator complex subunit Med13 n=1 Tax=Penicillium maclennaniae TaxID=1343394 RepID=UPI0025420D49|nr:Mediator complex subunit Med13 [Penicillium maclennaniae]KAJ5661966.1 Mediator complex subunit Med13 [Penicillium maclennaniae]